jgi:hypothetical protein
LIAYFLFFTWEGVRAPFSPDDMMNLANHWRHNPWQNLYGPFFLWHDFYRPMGGFFYLPLLEIVGLNPVPYHVALLALVLLYVGMVYRLARALEATPLEAWLAAMIVAYHAGVSNLYYQTIHIYDVLCGVFFAAALAAYANSRRGGRQPRARETAAFLGLYLCALNSKEMAVTLPVMLLAYEWLYGLVPKRGERRVWLRTAGWRIAVAAAMAALMIYGRVVRGLAHSSGYGSTFSFQRFAAFQQQQFRDLFSQWHYDGWLLIALAWVAVTYLAWRRPRPAPRFCWVFIVVTPLPIEFLEGRGGAALAVPLIGWAILAGIVWLAVMRTIAAAAADEPGLRRWSAQARLGVVMAAFLIAWADWNHTFLVHEVLPVIGQEGPLTEAVIRQFEVLKPRVRPHSLVVFLNDPFDSWDMAHIADLWFRDRTVAVRLQKKTPFSPEQLAKADYLFDWCGGKLVAGRACSAAAGAASQ